MLFPRNMNNDMRHLKSAETLREELAAGKKPQGLYGDSIGGKSFTDEESACLESRNKDLRPTLACGWREVWAGPGTTCWTVIDCTHETKLDRELAEEARASL